MSSIFSRIIAGDIPGCFVFQDPLWVGLLDLYPVSPGHLLLIPRHEVPRLAQLDGDSLAALGPLLARGHRCLYQALGCDAVATILRDGPAAGQEIAHVHVHLVPRHNGDDAHDFRSGSYGSDPEAAMTAMAERLRQAWDAVG